MSHSIHLHTPYEVSSQQIDTCQTRNYNYLDQNSPLLSSTLKFLASKLLEIWRSFCIWLQVEYNNFCNHRYEDFIDDPQYKLSFSYIKENINLDEFDISEDFLDISNIDSERAIDLINIFLKRTDLNKIPLIPVMIGEPNENYFTFFSISSTCQEIIFYDPKGNLIADHKKTRILKDICHLLIERFPDYKLEQNHTIEQKDPYNCSVYNIVKLRGIAKKKPFREITRPSYQEILKIRKNLNSPLTRIINNGFALLSEALHQRQKTS